MTQLAAAPSLFKGLKRTPQDAQVAITRFEAANGDLDPSQRRLLAVAAAARYFGRKNLEAALGKTLPFLPFRDWAWRWWNVLQLSGLAGQWPRFKELAEARGLRSALDDLRHRSTEEQFLLLLRRAGTGRVGERRKHNTTALWTKGGTWDKRNNFTKLLVLNQHLPERELLLPWQRRLGHDGVKRLEKELMHLVDPDKHFGVEARQLALDYARRRIPEMLNVTYKRASPKSLAWFFQVPIPGVQAITIAISRYPFYRRLRPNRPGDTKQHMWTW